MYCILTSFPIRDVSRSNIHQASDWLNFNLKESAYAWAASQEKELKKLGFSITAIIKVTPKPNNMSFYTEITQTVKQIAGENYLYLDEAVNVNGELNVYFIWALSVSPDGVLYVMDYNQLWTRVEPCASNAPVIKAVFSRIEKLKQQYKIAI